MVNFLGGPVVGLEIVNDLTEPLKATVRSCADQGKGFGFGRVLPKSGQVDLALLPSDEGKVGKFIQESVFPEDMYRVGLFRYLLQAYACYVEVPTNRTRDSQVVPTYDKFIATSNVEIAGNWMGFKEEITKDLYGTHLSGWERYEGDLETPYVKLSSTKAGNKVVKPRTLLDLGKVGMRVTPIPLIEAYVDQLQGHLNTGILKFEYQKDNRQTIELFSTFSREKLEEIYGVGAFVDDAITGAASEPVSEITTIPRGYIRVPKVGASRVNDEPLRALNIMRIMNIEFDAKPDLTFIDIDAKLVIPMFVQEINRHIRKPKYYVELVDEISARGVDHEYWFEADDTRLVDPTLDTVMTWVTERGMFFGSGFIKSLHQFMETCPELFPTYLDGGDEVPVIEGSLEFQGFL